MFKPILEFLSVLSLFLVGLGLFVLFAGILGQMIIGMLCMFLCGGLALAALIAIGGKWK